MLRFLSHKVVKDKFHKNGPWNDEPDVLISRMNGFNVLILRTDLGHLCGYVKIPKTHRYYEKPYDEIMIDCHGGITYSGKLHITNKWFIGFDCSHSDDLVPNCNYIGNKVTYKTIDFVLKELYKVTEQL